jgi:hypothetical protein
MTILFEHPWWIISIGIGVEALLAIALFISRRGMLLWWMLGALAVTLLCLLVERLVVTDRELIESTLYGGAAALEANDLSRVLSYFSPDAREARHVATLIMQRVEVQTARIYDLNVTINRHATPRTAQAVFLGYATYRDRRGEIPYTNYGTYLIVDLRKEGNTWILTGHIEEKNQEGRDRVINAK